MGSYKCVRCVEAYLETIGKMQPSGSAEVDEERRSREFLKINDAITLVPFWQDKTMLGQMMFQCVTLPICLDHIAPAKQSAESKAAHGGILTIPGQMG